MGICKDIMDQVRVGNYVEGFHQMISHPTYGTPIIVSVAVFLLSLVLTISSSLSGSKRKGTQINLTIKKDNPKVVDTVPCAEIENLAEFKDGKLVMCRCWKSKKFPYCDGSHAAHNKETGDNIGPLIITKPVTSK